MAKKEKKAEKARTKLINTLKEARSFETAHKIWLAGVGAYGKAYDAAADGVGKVNEQGADLFDDLVKRGEEIEGDVRSRLKSNTSFAKVSEQVNEQISKVNEQVSKVRDRVKEATDSVIPEPVAKFQDEQRERLEARMERMREALGLDKLTGKTEKTVAEETVVSKPKKAKKKTAHKVSKTKATASKVDENGRLKKPVGQPDDLTMIKGVGAVLAGKLNDAGIFHFWQIAALKKSQIAALEAELSFPGRATREAWKTQAKAAVKGLVDA